MKISKFQILVIIAFAFIICIDNFILEPIIKEKYLDSDIRLFEKGSWKYSIITFVIIYICFFIYETFNSKNKKNTSIVFFIYLTLPSLIIAFCLSHLTDNLTLYLNSIYSRESFKKEYLIQRYDKNKVFHLYDNKNEIISSKSELNRIDLIRNKNNLESLYELKNKDTIKVNYRKGFLNIKYLE